MMKKFVSILVLLMFFQSIGQAWPNNLIFTLKPLEGVEYLNNTLGFELIEENSGDTYIGKFKNPNEAEVAQTRLENVGISTDMMAFFRARPIDIDEAKILSKNMNAEEESTMLSGTTKVWPGKVMRDTMKLKESKTVSKPEDPIVEQDSEEKISENTVNTTFFVIQLGVFSKSSKHNFQIDVQERVINGKYYCFYGEFNAVDDAETQLIKIKDKGYNDAFITGLDQGKKVSPSVIKEKLNIL